MAVPMLNNGDEVTATEWNAHANQINTNTNDIAALQGRVEEFGQITANVAAGGFQSYTVTLSKSFPTAPHPNIVSGNGRTNIAVSNVTTTGFNIDINNWTSGSTGDFTVYWQAVEKV